MKWNGLIYYLRFSPYFKKYTWYISSIKLGNQSVEEMFNERIGNNWEINFILVFVFICLLLNIWFYLGFSFLKSVSVKYKIWKVEKEREEMRLEWCISCKGGGKSGVGYCFSDRYSTNLFYRKI